MHDRNGNELKVGDTVALFATITSINSTSEEFCNVTIQSLDGRRPDGQKETECLNTGVLTLVKKNE